MGGQCGWVYVFLCSVFLLFALSAPAFASTATTKANYVACVSESSLNVFMKYLAAKDKASMDTVIALKQCFSLAAGIKVTVLEGPGAFGTKVKFGLNGHAFWTIREGLNHN